VTRCVTDTLSGGCWSPSEHTSSIFGYAESFRALDIGIMEVRNLELHLAITCGAVSC
jgi:hypothetical protein